MKKRLMILLALLLLLTACAPKNPPAPDPEPAPPVTEVAPEPEPEPIPEPEPLSYTVGETAKNLEYDGLQVNILLPVLTGENQAALDVINNYYQLLSGKVLDYAEGDLLPQPDLGITYEVNAGYDVTHATENTVSILWQVVTVTSAESPIVATQSAAVFDVKTGNLFTFDDIFGKNAGAAKQWFVEETKTVIANAPNNYYEHASQLADGAFDPDTLYFDATGVNIFYPRDALGFAVVVVMPYDTAAEYLAIEP